VSKLDAYLRRHAQVPGWLDPYSASFIVALARIQSEAGITGGVAEIGVHMGRLFILLKLLAGSEKAVAIDIFGDQHLNVDHSGHGDRELFLANVERHASSNNLEIIQRSSLEILPEDIVSRARPCRLFSVDGGHTEACTINDLMLAERSTAEKGIVILDDYFNPSWPDVSTGAASYFLSPQAELKPFAITPNKLYLARPDCHGFYHAALMRSERDFHEKDSRLFGADVSVFGVTPETHALPRAAKRWVRRSVVGPPLVTARQRLRAATGR
jgi:hypothetical protein